MSDYAELIAELRRWDGPADDGPVEPLLDRAADAIEGLDRACEQYSLDLQTALARAEAAESRRTSEYHDCLKVQDGLREARARLAAAQAVHDEITAGEIACPNCGLVCVGLYDRMEAALNGDPA